MPRHDTRDHQALAASIRAGKEHRTRGALSGRPGPVGSLYGSRLPSRYWESAYRATYVVESYATPIAWRLPSGRWVVPDVEYSISTTQHQSTAQSAIEDLMPRHEHRGIRIRDTRFYGRAEGRRRPRWVAYGWHDGQAISVTGETLREVRAGLDIALDLAAASAATAATA